MNTYRGRADPPRSLAERVRRVDDSLRAMMEDVKTSIATVVGEAIADAVRDAIQRLLGGERRPIEPTRREVRDPWEHDPWADERDDGWSEVEEDFPPRLATKPDSRWREVAGAALTAALWCLKNPPSRRAFLATAGMTLVAGAAAFLVGPAFASCAGVVASLAGML